MPVTNVVTIDELLTGSSKTGATFNITDYQKHLTSEEYKQEQLKALAQNYQQQQVLKRNQMNILKAIADPEKRDKLFTAVCVVHKNILEEQDESIGIEDVMTHSFEKPEELSFLIENKHSKFYRSTDVLDTYEEHPVQKQLVKGKYIGRRLVKKQKTPMQHFNTLIEAKSKMSKDQRLEALEQGMEETRRMLALLANNQLELASQLDTAKKSLDDLSKVVKDLRKLKLYVLICNNKGKTLTNKELATSLDISERTVKYWKKELRTEGYL